MKCKCGHPETHHSGIYNRQGQRVGYGSCQAEDEKGEFGFCDCKKFNPFLVGDSK